MSEIASVEIRRADRPDAAAIAAVATDTFPLACPPETSKADIADYVSSHFTEAVFLAELDTTGVAVYLAVADDSVVGYAVLHADEAPSVAGDFRRPAHLRRLYVQQSHHGQGVAHALLRQIVRHARTHDYDFLWLGTHETNSRAIKFYTRHKFEIIGTREFKVGGSVECDLVLARSVDQTDH